jgi:uncharacterized membrane protein
MRIMLAALLLFAHAARAQSLVSIGTAPGGRWSVATGVSADGLVVSAYSDAGVASSDRAYRWTGDMGLVPITPDGVIAVASAVSADGRTFVGYGPLWNGGFIVHPEHGYEAFDNLDQGFATMATAVSGDGSVVVGQASFPESWPTGTAMRWQRETAACEDLGLLPGHEASHAYGISADGSIICGNSRPDRSSDLYQRPIRWTNAGIEELSLLPGHQTGAAFGVSGDGSTIVGLSIGGDSSWLQLPVRWRGLTLEPLAWPSTFTAGAAGLATNHDGTVTVGVAIYAVGDLHEFRAALWSPYLGAVDLNNYLSTLGIDTTGWVLEYARGVSADGRVIVGHGYLDGQTRGWVLTLPPPCGTADFNNDGEYGTDQDIEAFFACLSGHCCPACPEAGTDFNADGDTGTDSDIEAFFRVLAGGNC